MEHEERAEGLERQADALEHEGERVERDIEETRRDWDQKEHDSSVPGAQPGPDEDEHDVAGIETELGERDEPMGPARQGPDEEG